MHTIKRKKANWIGHMLRRNSLLKHIIERKIEGGREVTKRQGRRSKQLLETRKLWKWKEEALDCTLWGTSFERGYGTVARQSTE
jgi:hypothetical protein